MTALCVYVYLNALYGIHSETESRIGINVLVRKFMHKIDVFVLYICIYIYIHICTFKYIYVSYIRSI